MYSESDEARQQFDPFLPALNRFAHEYNAILTFSTHDAPQYTLVWKSRDQKDCYGIFEPPSTGSDEFRLVVQCFKSAAGRAQFVGGRDFGMFKTSSVDKLYPVLVMAKTWSEG